MKLTVKTETGELVRVNVTAFNIGASAYESNGTSFRPVGCTGRWTFEQCLAAARVEARNRRKEVENSLRLVDMDEKDLGVTK